MSILSRRFAKKPKAPPLAPLVDGTLGELVWDEDSEGWTGVISSGMGSVRLYIGSGSSQTYPSEAIRALLREPYRDFDHLAEVALSYLLEHMDTQAWKANPGAFQVDGLESYDQYLSTGTYTITFTNGDDEAIWKVHFEKGQATGCGVDD